jgi:MFS superfamily sulfate permease-like transporter
LISGIIGGIVVSLISGSHLSVSGPAAGLTTLVASAIISLGDYKIFLLCVVIAGLFQLLLGAFRLGIFASYFPSSVIKGMLAAIGIILISKQIPIALGYDHPDFWTSAASGLISFGNESTGFQNFGNTFSYNVIVITLLSLSALILLQLPFAKKLKFIPAPLIAVLVGVLANYILTATGSGFELGKDKLVNIPDNIFQNIATPDFSMLMKNPSIWVYGIIIGLLATLETLLCVEAVDKLDHHNRITPPNRELVAQGIGNMLCGICGAIPMTAVVVRGAANANAGAKSKLSSFTHGIFLLLAVLLVPFALNSIPYASLAAILLITGFNLTKPKLYVSMWRLGMKQFLPFIITIVVILSTDLLIGVCIGLLISIYFIVQNNFKAEYKISKTLQHETEVYLIKLNSNVTFLNKVNLRKALDQIPEYSILTIDGSECNFIDHDILEIISSFETKAHDRHIELHLKGIEKVEVSSLH